MTTTSPGWLPPSPWASSAPGWTAPKDPIVVDLGGLILRTDGPGPATGTWEFGVESIVGWWESPEDRSPVTPHPSGVGQIADTEYVEARTITISGEIEATEDYGPGSLEAALDELSRIKRTTLRIEEPNRGLNRELDVRKERTSLPDRYAPWLARVTLTLVADDPLRYGSGYTTLTNGSQTLINRGDETAWPLLDIVGPHSALSIVHPGGTWTLPALGSGVVRTVDFREGAVFDGNGAHVFGTGEGSGPLPRVPAGGASWTVSGIGSGSIRARRTEAWS